MFFALVAVFLLISFLGETALRVAGTFKIHGEENGLGYISPYDWQGKDWFRKHRPGSRDLVKIEYTERFYVNERGFRDREWPVTKEPDEIRILALGGSFVEGVGSVRQLSNYPNRLNEKLNDKFGKRAKILVMNGGISGSDPIDNLQSLKRVFYDYMPDLIVQSVDSGDWKQDIPLRGGVDRFEEDGTFIGVQGPWFEPIFEHSHLFRAFLLEVLRYDTTLMSRSEVNRRADQAVREICRVFKEQRTFARKLDADLVVVIKAGRGDIIRQKEPSERQLSLMACAKKHAATAFDLGAKLSERFSPKEIEKLYWPIDGHFNPDGYEAYAQIVAAAIEPLVTSRVGRRNPSPVAQP